MCLEIFHQFTRKSIKKNLMNPFTPIDCTIRAVEGEQELSKLIRDCN